MEDTAQGDPKPGKVLGAILQEVVNNFLCRMPHRINAAEIVRYGISVAARTAHNISSKTGKNMGVHALHIMESIRAADLLHVDETSLLPNGKNVWVWIFLNPRTGDTLHVIRKSRGSDLIGEVLGSDWKDTLVCDGRIAYKLQCSDVPGSTCCARSELPCARILTVRRQGRCRTSSQGRTSAGRISKKISEFKAEEKETSVPVQAVQVSERTHTRDPENSD